MLPRCCFNVEGGQQQWLARIAAQLIDDVDEGFGLFMTAYDRVPNPRSFAVHLERADPINLQMARAGVAPNSPVGEILKTAAVLTSCEAIGDEYLDALFDSIGWTLPAREALGIVSPDTCGGGSLISIVRERRGPASFADRRMGNAIIPLMSAGARLRRIVSSTTQLVDQADMIFDSSGKCVEAAGEAKEGNAIETLREHIVGRYRGGSAERLGERVALQPLIDGCWSIVDHFDGDGKHFLVAFRNPEGVVDPRRLSAREREIVLMAAKGMSQKEIGTELGVSRSTVASTLSFALTKLGLRRSREIPSIWRSMEGEAVSVRMDDNLELLLCIERGSGEAPPSALSKAEREVMEELVRGKTNAQISELRGVAERTVANQVASIFKKLGLNSRQELAAKYGSKELSP